MRVKLIDVNHKYGITDDGHVFNLERGNELKPFTNPKGYMLVRLGKRDTYQVHRLVAKAFVHNSNVDTFNQVNHIDGDKANNNFMNLEWTNNSGNQIHAHATGLQPVIRGEDKVQAKLTGHQVGMFCELLEQGLGTCAAARQLGIYELRHTLRQVKDRKNWKHVSIKYNF